MGQKNPNVDAYIAKSAAFAKPILIEIRDTVHASCPDVIEEMKWSFPHFTYKGMLCSMAAFKQHAALGFWKGTLVLGRARGGDAMGHFGRITDVSQLPPRKTLAGYVKKAATLNDRGVKVVRAPKPAAPAPLRVPAVLAAALKKHKKAETAFKALPPSHKREYIAWITEAKMAETKARRAAQAIEWIAAGRSRNRKYEKRR